MPKKQSPAVPAIAPRVREKINEMQQEQHVVAEIFGQKGVAFFLEDVAYVGFLPSGQLAIYEGEGVNVITVRRSVERFQSLATNGSGEWSGGGSYGRWIEAVLNAIPA